MTASKEAGVGSASGGSPHRAWANTGTLGSTVPVETAPEASDRQGQGLVNDIWATPLWATASSFSIVHVGTQRP